MRQGDAGPIALLVLAAFLVLGGVFSIGNGNGWFAPLWLIPVAAIGWFVLARRGTGTPQSGYGAPQVGAPQQQPGQPAPATPVRQRHPRPRQERPCRPPPRRPRMPASAARPVPRPPARQPTGVLPRPGQPGTTGPAGTRSRPVRWPAHSAGARRARSPRPPPPRPRRRRPSAFVGLVSLGIALVGIGPRCGPRRPARLPGQLGHPRLPHRPDRCVGRRAHPRPAGAGPPASAASSSWCSPCCSWPPRPPPASTCRTASATAPGPRCPPPEPRASSSVPVRPPST